MNKIDFPILIEFYQKNLEKNEQTDNSKSSSNYHADENRLRKTYNDTLMKNFQLRNFMQHFGRKKNTKK